MTGAAARKAPQPPAVELVHVTTVPQSLWFFSGHAHYLQVRNFRVRAVSSPGDLLDRFHTTALVPVHAVPMARAFSPVSDAVALWRLWRLFLTIKPDIVHSHTPKAGLLGTLAARLAGVRVAFLSVFGLPQMTRTGPARHMLNVTTRLACAAAHRVWCDSSSVRDYLSQSGLCRPDKIVVFGEGSVDGVDAQETFSPERRGREIRADIRARHGIPNDAVVIGYVGRIVRDKGMQELVAAWKTLRGQSRPPRADARLIRSHGPAAPRRRESAAKRLASALGRTSIRRCRTLRSHGRVHHAFLSRRIRHQQH